VIINQAMTPSVGITVHKGRARNNIPKGTFLHWTVTADFGVGQKTGCEITD